MVTTLKSFKLSDESSKMVEYRQVPRWLNIVSHLKFKAILPLKSLESDLYNQHSLHASAKTGL
jgi:hypothetical protein